MFTATRSPQMLRTAASATRGSGGVLIRPVVRKAGFRFPNQGAKRWQSTSTQSASGNAQVSPLVAGMAGGLVTLMGGYTWYNLSGTKKVVQSARSTIETLESAKAKITSAIPSAPSSKEALAFIRNTTKNYSSFLPAGTSESIDKAISSVEDLADTHGPELEAIVSKTYDELKSIFQKGGINTDTAQQVAAVIEKRSKEIVSLAGDLGSDILSRNPKLAESLPGGGSEIFKELKSLSSQHGPEAKSLAEKTYSDLSSLLKDGSVTDPRTLAQASSLLQDRLSQLRDIASKAGEKAWEETKKQAYEQGYMDKLPSEVRSYLESNMDGLKSFALGGFTSGGGIGAMYSLWNMLQKYSSTDLTKESNLNELKSFVENKVRQGKDMSGGVGSRGWEKTVKMVEDYVKTIPGGEKVLENTPPLNELLNLAKQKSPEARQLMEDTLSDLSNVLNKRLQEARELAKETKEEGKQKAGKKQ